MSQRERRNKKVAYLDKFCSNEFKAFCIECVKSSEKEEVEEE